LLCIFGNDQVLDDVLPMLPQIPSKDPAVIMGILGIYKIALEHPRLGIPKETIATQVSIVFLNQRSCVRVNRFSFESPSAESHRGKLFKFTKVQVLSFLKQKSGDS
jgi:hypothetical protein